MSLERLLSPCLPPPRGIYDYRPIEMRGGGGEDRVVILRWTGIPELKVGSSLFMMNFHGLSHLKTDEKTMLPSF